MDQCVDFTVEILEFCKKRYKTLKRNIDEALKGTSFQKAPTDLEVRRKFFEELDRRIQESQGEKRKENMKKILVMLLGGCFIPLYLSILSTIHA